MKRLVKKLASEALQKSLATSPITEAR